MRLINDKFKYKFSLTKFSRKGEKIFQNEKKLKTLEEKRTDALEMAAQEDEKGKKEKKGLR